MDVAFFVLSAFVLSYFVLLNSIYLLLLAVSFFSLAQHRRQVKLEQWRRVIQSPVSMPVSIIAPAYNEALTIAESVKSLLTLRYPRFEVVVVNDGSTDETIEVLKRTFHLVEVLLAIDNKVACKGVRGVYRSPLNGNLLVVDKVNGGKADALNAGLNVARFPLVCSIDADSILEGEALLRVTKPFLENRPTVVAAGGIIRVANGCTIKDGRVLQVRLPTNPLVILQAVEYLRAFLFGRLGWNAMRSLLIISGAFGVFRRDVVIAAGGYSPDTVGEDVELVVRLHRYLRDKGRDYEMCFLPDPVCWTLVPVSLRVLSRQRNRWHRGLADTLLRHRSMFLNPRYGPIGLIAFPYFVLFEMLSPVVEMAGYVLLPISYLLGFLDNDFLVLFGTLAILLGLTLSTSSVVLEELSFRRYGRSRDMLKLLAGALLENFGYRQLHCWWRFMGLVDYFRKKSVWGAMERKGFAP